MSQRAYVRHDGTLTRDAPTLPRFSTGRLLFVLSVLTVLIVSNPANGMENWLPRDWWRNVRYHATHNSSQSASWFKSKIGIERKTNYGVFALEKTYTTITVTGLLNTANLCYFDTDDDLSRAFCNTIADNLCHGKPLLDWNDLSYATCQLMSFLLIASMLLSFCAFGLPVLRVWKYRWADSVLSLFYGINLLDVVRWNIIGYPTLASMERIISSYVYTKDAIRLNMAIGCVILILGVGGTANYVGSLIKPNERVVGLDGLLAACLGYNVAVGKSMLFSFLSVRVTNTTYFWLELGYLFLLGRHGLFIAVLAGGMLGHFFGVMHHQWLLESLLEQLRSSWRRFWR